MRWLVALVLALALGVMPVMGCGPESPCGDCSDGNPCTKDECVFVWFYLFGSGPTGYQCDHDPVRDGTPCGSGNVCVDGRCKENLCQGVSCDDGNPCTRDYCRYYDGRCNYDRLHDEPCPHESGRGICDRGVCGENLCVDVVCDDGNPCTENECDYHTGCVFEPVWCDDDNQCTEDNCNPLNGRCDFTTPVEDGEGCWADFPQWDVGICEAGVCVPPCDPASGIVTPCPHDYYIAGYCCPGSEFCADGCRPCGDGVAKPPEKCDGVDLAGTTCADFGFTGGTLTCLSDCSGFDTSSCTTTCGNDVVEPDERCDGIDLAGMTCADFGFTGGTLTCLSDCSGFDTSNCAAICGNDVVEPGELCDGVDLQGSDCTDFPGFTRGTLGCTTECTFDTSGCIRPVCGDNIEEGTERCDGTDLGNWTGRTCADFGFPGGTLACNATCDNLDLTDCFGGPSGWTCPVSDYDDFWRVCHCGCGVFDPDCDSWAAVDCDSCGDPGSCSPFNSYCDDIDPTTGNWLCRD